jgi:hypothetical protein
MTKSKCPHGGFRLGNYLYADACPECREELTHNTNLLTAAAANDPARIRIWPLRLLRSVARFSES